jgi:hypothetical protein
MLQGREDSWAERWAVVGRRCSLQFLEENVVEDELKTRGVAPEQA